MRQVSQKTVDILFHCAVSSLSFSVSAQSDSTPLSPPKRTLLPNSSYSESKGIFHGGLPLLNTCDLLAASPGMNFDSTMLKIFSRLNEQAQV